MFKNATIELNIQKFKSLKNIENFRKIFENVLSKLNIHINAFI